MPNIPWKTFTQLFQSFFQSYSMSTVALLDGELGFHRCLKFLSSLLCIPTAFLIHLFCNSPLLSFYHHLLYSYLLTNSYYINYFILLPSISIFITPPPWFPFTLKTFLLLTLTLNFLLSHLCFKISLHCIQSVKYHLLTLTIPHY